MPDQPYAARLRQRAARARDKRNWPSMAEELDMSPDEADAIADALEAADAAPCTCTPGGGQKCRFHDALDRLAHPAEPDHPSSRA